MFESLLLPWHSGEHLREHLGGHPRDHLRDHLREHLKESFREQRGLKRGNLSEHFREQISKREQREPLIFEGHSFGRRGVGAMPCGGLFSYV